MARECKGMIVTALKKSCWRESNVVLLLCWGECNSGQSDIAVGVMLLKRHGDASVRIMTASL